MKTSKILTGIVSLAIALGTLSVAAGAVEPSYKVSDDYKDTLYYDNLRTYELTGDGATDVIAVALSQLGYHEGNSNADLDGLSRGGSRNFTEYNVLFGKLDNGEGNGTSYGYAWCAAFVNWCLRQARVDKELTGGMYVSCASWRNWFINDGAKFGASYYARTDGYIPQKGDLIFYKSLSATHNRATDHIGIVLKCENGKVYAIEGNADNRVGLHEYDLNNRYIVGYGNIAYKTAPLPEVDYYATEDYLPGFFVANKGTVPMYNGAAGSTTGKKGSLPAGCVYRITAVQGMYGCVTDKEGVTGWVPLKRLTPMTADPYYSVEIEAGEQSVKAILAQGASWTIPDLTPGADFMGWSAGEGSELYAAGQVITPASDLVLQPVYPAASETESETDAQSSEVTGQDSETEPLSPETAEQGEQSTQGVQGTESASDASSDAAMQQGCYGTVGACAGGLMLAVCAAFVTKKRK